MYKNKFLAIIKKDGKPVRELAGTYIGLPFNTEYTIELRNDNYQRAVARIYIDGMEAVIGGIVVNAKSAVTVERFVLDGDMNKGKKFKFVEFADAVGSDPSNIKNGIVEIVFTLEKSSQRKAMEPFVTWDCYPYHGSGSYPYVINMSEHPFPSQVVTCYNVNNADTSKQLLFDSQVNYSARSVQKQGVTAEGSVSHQKFDTVTTGEMENTSTTITFFLKGVEVIIENKIYCSKCGKKTKSDHTFCPHCGARIELE